MRLMHVISGLGTGGAESFLARLAPGLATLGFQQTVVSLTGEGELAAPLRQAGIEVVALEARGAAGPVRTVLALRRLIGDRRPDAIQGWMYHGDLLATLAHRTSRGRRRRRLYWGIRCSDMRLQDYALQLRLVVSACARLSPLADAILANSAAGARVHVAAGYRPRRLVVVPNGIDCQAFAPDPAARAAVRAELAIGPDETVLIHVARVDPMKDHAGLLAAFEAVPEARLLLIGTGTETLNRLPRVTGLGRRGDVARLLAAADAIVSSSAYGEGFSNAIAEGMAAGLTAVATDVGDAAEIVGDTGTVVPPGDPSALAAALRRLVGMPAADRVALGTAARGRIADRFALARAIERFEAVYRQ